MTTPFTQKLPYDYHIENFESNNETISAGETIDLINIENDIFLEYALMYKTSVDVDDVDLYLSINNKIIVSTSPDLEDRGFGIIPITYMINSYFVPGVDSYDGDIYQSLNLLSCNKLRLWFYNGTATSQEVYSKIKYFTKE